MHDVHSTAAAATTPTFLRLPLLRRHARVAQVLLVAASALAIFGVLPLGVGATSTAFLVLVFVVGNGSFLALEALRGCPSCRSGALHGAFTAPLTCDRCGWQDGTPLVPQPAQPPAWHVAVPLVGAIALAALSSHTQTTGGRSVAASDWPAYPLMAASVTLMGATLLLLGARWDSVPRWVHALCRPQHAATPAILGVVATLAGVGMALYTVLARFGG